MEYGQEPIRKTLVKYCTEKGIKYKHIASKLNLTNSTICHFVRHDRQMRQNNFNNLVKLLQHVGYLE